MRVLIVTWDGGGNLAPALGIGRALRERGDDVRVLGHRIQHGAVEEAGLPFAPIRIGRDHVSADPRGTIDGILGAAALFADRGIGKDARALLDDRPADVVLVDCLLWGATVELAGTGIPIVRLVHSIADFFDRNARGPLGTIARLRGSDPAVARKAAALDLVTTRPDFEPRATDSGIRVRHTGFVWQDHPPVESVAPGPRVLVSFSTTVFPGQRRVLQRALDALEPLDVEVIATTGAVDAASLRAPANARVVRRLDHGEILPTTSLVIGHGGHSTTARALSHGVPVLALPMHPLMDQPAVGRAIRRLGVGSVLPKRSSAARIRAEVVSLLGDPDVRAAAARVGAEARERDGAQVAITALQEVADTCRAAWPRTGRQP